MIKPGPLEIGLLITVVMIIAVISGIVIAAANNRQNNKNKPSDYKQLLSNSGKLYCRNCGKELAGFPEYCMGCGARPLAGFNFCPACGGPTNQLSEICVKCGAQLKQQEVDVSEKSRLAVTLLAFFLGELGIHRFYLGKIGTGILMLVTLGGLGIWSLIDFIIAVSGAMRDKEGKLIKNW